MAAEPLRPTSPRRLAKSIRRRRGLSSFENLIGAFWSAPGERQKRLARANRRSSGADAAREFVTPFFPVMQGGELIPLDGGQLVRVRMPRSNLIPLGIPIRSGTRE